MTRMTFPARFGLRLENKKGESLTPVSYTHLDVYKRQGVGGIEWHQNDVVNPYQGNVQKLYKNAIDYLKTK